MRSANGLILLALVFVSTVVAMPYNAGPPDQPDYLFNLSRRVPEPQLSEPNRPSTLGEKAPGDTVRGIVLLIDFPDMPADTAHRGIRFQQMLFDGPWPNGTMTEYFREVSYNAFTVTGTVDTIWYQAANNHDYYGYSNGMARAAALVREAVLAADAVVDFSQYDNNGDGEVDGLFVIHAGPGREEGSAGDNNIHSHKWYLSSAGVGSVYTDGVTVNLYSIEPEEHFYSQYSVGYHKIISKGVFCHEFGHVIGLPDLYDTDYSSQGIGNYCLMSGGSWGGNGQTPFRPVHPSPWIKQRTTSMKSSWITPTAVAVNLYDQKLPPIETSPSLFKFWKNGVYGQQYFLVENRTRIGHDSLLPNSGLLIWHIDESISNNNNELRKLVDLECATGLVLGGGTKDHLDTTMASYDFNDYWCPATGKTSFNPFSNPSSKDYSNALTMCAANNIVAAAGDTFMLDIFIGGSNLTLSGARLNDAAGDHDSLSDPGESVGLAVTLANTAGWVNATTVSARLSTPDTSILVTDSLATFSNINAGSSGSCSADSFVYYVKPGILPHNVKFVLTKSCSQGTCSTIDTIVIPIGHPRVLLVDDDNGSDYEKYYQVALDSNQVLYRNWTVASQGSPAADTLAQFPIVIWYTGNDSLNTLTTADTTVLKTYLNGGGKLFLSSKQLGQQLGTTAFYADYLHATYLSNNAGQLFVRGVTGNPVGSSLVDTLALGGTNGANNGASPDKIAAINGADSAFVYRTTGGAAAVTYDGVYKLAYFGFPFEAIGGSAPRFIQRTEIMRRILAWFGGVMPQGLESQPAVIPARPGLRISCAPNPFGKQTGISYHLPMPGMVELAVYNVAGQKVRTLIKGRQPAGENRITWDGRDESGRKAAAGVYLARLNAAGRSAASKLVLVR
jgi:M6 family metalloprotease-like protein